MLSIGHRGARGHAPENTLASVRKAIALGADWIEVDVYWLDGELVVFHDQHLERTTNGKGLLMAQPFDQLRRLDAGNGEQIPTLAEVFATVAAGSERVGINVELKGLGTAEPVVRFLQAGPLRGEVWDLSRVVLSCFRWDELARVRAIAPEIRLGALLAELPPGGVGAAIVQAQAIGAWSLNPAQAIVTPALVQAAQAAGLQVWVFTVNEPGEIARLGRMGVDGLFSDYPERVAG